MSLSFLKRDFLLLINLDVREMKKVLILLAACIVAFSNSSWAEFLLVDKKTSNDSVPSGEKESIFENILLKYQWPMISANFHQLPLEEQNKYLEYLEKYTGGSLAFMKSRLEMEYKDKYDLIFIPDTIFELAVIYVYTNERNDNKRDDFEVGPVFERDLNENIIEAIKNSNKSENTIINTLDIISEGYGKFNKNRIVKDLYFKAVNYIIKNDLYSKDRHMDVVESLGKLTGHTDKQITYLKEACKLQTRAFKENHFLLFRGSSGVDIGGGRNIIDFPFREGFAQLTQDKGIPKPGQTLVPPRESFTPTSLSFGNTILIGKFSQSGHPLNYVDSFNYGYALSFPIKDYLTKNPKVLSLSKKYLISPLHTIAGLFGFGEYYHSRSKVSILEYNHKIPWSKFIKGIMDSITPGEDPKSLVEYDLHYKTGLIILPDVDWYTLSGSIGEDIGYFSHFIKRPSDKIKEEAITAQRYISSLASFESEAFQKHQEKFAPVLQQILTNKVVMLEYTKKLKEDFPAEIEKLGKIGNYQFFEYKDLMRLSSYLARLPQNKNEIIEGYNKIYSRIKEKQLESSFHLPSILMSKAIILGDKSSLDTAIEGILEWGKTHKQEVAFDEEWVVNFLAKGLLYSYDEGIKPFNLQAIRNAFHIVLSKGKAE